MTNLHHIKHVAEGGKKIIETLAPLPERKDPLVAFGAGFMLGALGVGLYLKSAKDFFVCAGLFLAASVLLPGLGSILGWVFAPIYGAYRAHSSNQQLGL